nr:12614_t:CDS:2 [Entrophospora candida]
MHSDQEKKIINVCQTCRQPIYEGQPIYTSSKGQSSGYTRGVYGGTGFFGNYQGGAYGGHHSEEQKAEEEKEKLLLEQKAQDLYQKVNNFTLTFALKKNEKNEPLGSVNYKEILQELEKKGFQLKKSQLVDFHPLHNLGENAVKIKLTTTKLNNFQRENLTNIRKELKEVERKFRLEVKKNPQLKNSKITKKLENSSSNSNNQQNTPSYSEQITRLQEEIAQLTSQLAEAETNSDEAEKQRLQNIIVNKNQQIQNLLNNNPNQGPNQNPPLPPGSTKGRLTLSYNGEVGGKHEYININNGSERLLIDKKNPIFASGTNLNIKDNHYIFTFDKKNIAKNDLNNYIIDENKTDFSLNNAYAPPPPVDPKENTGPEQQPRKKPNSNGFNFDNFNREEPNGRNWTSSGDYEVNEKFKGMGIGLDEVEFLATHPSSTKSIKISKNNPLISKIGLDRIVDHYFWIKFHKGNDNGLLGISYYFDAHNEQFDLEPIDEFRPNNGDEYSSHSNN